MPYCSRALNVPSGSAVVTRADPRTVGRAAANASLVAPMVRSASAAGEDPAAMPSNRCSVDTYSSPSAWASLCAAVITAAIGRESPGWATEPPDAVGRVVRIADTRWASAGRSTPTASSRPPATPPGWVSSAPSRCTGSSWGFPALAAPCRPAASASWDLVVSFGSMPGAPPGERTANGTNDRRVESIPLTSSARDARWGSLCDGCASAERLARTEVSRAQTVWEGPVMRTRRLLGAAALTTFIAVGLTGCVKMDMQLDLQSDNTVDGTMVF